MGPNQSRPCVENTDLICQVSFVVQFLDNAYALGHDPLFLCTISDFAAISICNDAVCC